MLSTITIRRELAKGGGPRALRGLSHTAWEHLEPGHSRAGGRGTQHACASPPGQRAVHPKAGRTAPGRILPW